MITGTDILCLADAAVFCRLDRNFHALYKKAEDRGEVLPLLRLAHTHFAGSFPQGRYGDRYDAWVVATLFVQLLKQKPITSSFLDRLLTTLEHFAIPEAYPCPHGIPDLSKFPGVADLAAAGLLPAPEDTPESDQHPADTAQADPEAPEDPPLTQQAAGMPEETPAQLAQGAGGV